MKSRQGFSLLILVVVMALFAPSAWAQCAAHVSVSTPWDQVLALLPDPNNGNAPTFMPVRRNGNQYEVFFTLVGDNEYNPSGACNLGDEVISRLDVSNNLTSATLVTGANPLVQRSVLLTPSNPAVGAFYCFKFKWHQDVSQNIDNAVKEQGSVFLPSLNSLSGSLSPASGVGLGCN
jgi:hypothetical protein